MNPTLPDDLKQTLERYKSRWPLVAHHGWMPDIWMCLDRDNEKVAPVWKRLERLKGYGYTVEIEPGRPTRNYRIVKPDGGRAEEEDAVGMDMSLGKPAEEEVQLRDLDL